MEHFFHCVTLYQKSEEFINADLIVSFLVRAIISDSMFHRLIWLMIYKIQSE